MALTAYNPAPIIYRTPCNTSQVRPIRSRIESIPYISSPWSTGNTADNPIVTNIPALYGLHAGVRKVSNIDTVAQPTPSEQIYDVSVTISGVDHFSENIFSGLSYHGPVNFLKCRLAVESVVYAWDERSRDQAYNSHIIQLISKLSHPWRMV